MSEPTKQDVLEIAEYLGTDGEELWRQISELLNRQDKWARADQARLSSNLTPMQRLVLKACRAQPEAIDDDAVLQATVWLMEGWSDQRSLLENLRALPRAESLSRRRRELVGLGILEPSDEANAKRHEAFVNELERHSSVNVRELHKNQQEALFRLSSMRTMDPR